MAVGGNSPAPMNWPGTTANTQGTARSSARSATGPSPGRTTSPYTWRGTFKSQRVDGTHTARREFSIFLNLSHCLPTRGGAQLASTTIMVKFPTSQLVSGSSGERRNPKNKNRRTDGVYDWIFYHSNSKSNLNMLGLTKRHGRDWKLWISGYKLDPWVGEGGKTRILWNCFDAI